MTRFAVEEREAFQKHVHVLFQEEVDHSFPEPELLALEAAFQPTPLPIGLSEEEQETLRAQQVQNHDWSAKGGGQHREVRGLSQRRSDQRVSTPDPDATPMRHGRGPVHPGYHVHYAVDAGKQRMLLAALVAPAEVMENQPMLDLLWHVRVRWRLRPRPVIGDTTYGKIENIKGIEDAGRRAYIPLFNRENEHGASFGSSRFTSDADNNGSLCPNGQQRHLSRMEDKAEKAEDQADAAVCNACPLKAQSTPSLSGRQVHRSFHAVYRERVQGYSQTEASQKALDKRNVWVDPFFGEAKEWHSMRRFRLRRLWKVNGEALVIATGQNLTRLLKKRGWGRRPFPPEAMVLMPPGSDETGIFPETALLRNQRANVAVAFLVFWEVATRLVVAQRSPFSIENIAHVIFPSDPFSILYPFLTVFPVLDRMYLYGKSFGHCISSIDCKLSKDFFNKLVRYVRQIGERASTFPGRWLFVLLEELLLEGK